VNGRVILYADTRTRSIEATLSETGRRRKIQAAYNAEYGITPESIKKDIKNILGTVYEMDYVTVPIAAEQKAIYKSTKDIPRLVKKLKKEMQEAARHLEFEKAAELRDQLYELERRELELS
jgi:excinuclease ABC subunit B